MRAVFPALPKMKSPPDFQVGDAVFFVYSRKVVAWKQEEEGFWRVGWDDGTHVIMMAQERLEVLN